MTWACLVFIIVWRPLLLASAVSLTCPLVPSPWTLPFNSIHMASCDRPLFSFICLAAQGYVDASPVLSEKSVGCLLGPSIHVSHSIISSLPTWVPRCLKGFSRKPFPANLGTRPLPLGSWHLLLFVSMEEMCKPVENFYELTCAKLRTIAREQKSQWIEKTLQRMAVLQLILCNRLKGGDLRRVLWNLLVLD